MESLQQDYDLAIDWSGTLFYVITLTWDYTNLTVNLSRPAYIAKAHTKFQHSPPSHQQHSLHKHNPIKYDVQVSLLKDNAPLLSMAKLKDIQEIVGTLLYYSQAMDPKLVCAISSIAAKQTNGTAFVLDACHQLLDYVTTHHHVAYVTMPAKNY